MPKIKQHEINPETGKDYTDGFYSSLYNTFVSFGLNEQNLIWIRYSAFLILQGFIINAVTTGTYQGIVLLCLSIFGIACSMVWHILNFCGWLNQNVWFSMAAGLNFNKLTVRTPTLFWEIEHSRKPAGKIYYIAQSIPLSLTLIYAVISAIAINKMISKWELTAFVALFLIVIATLFVRNVENKEYDKCICDVNPLS